MTTASKSKRALPVRRLCTRIEAEEILGKQVFTDALIAGWLKPRTLKKWNSSKKQATQFYALSDIRFVEDRMLGGEYPEPKKA